jgi:hypothetical protein
MPAGLLPAARTCMHDASAAEAAWSRRMAAEDAVGSARPEAGITVDCHQADGIARMPGPRSEIRGLWQEHSHIRSPRAAGGLIRSGAVIAFPE